jgi:hypothetical protein
MKPLVPVVRQGVPGVELESDLRGIPCQNGGDQQTKRILALFAIMFLSVATPAFAHRLDEYLQATTFLVLTCTNKRYYRSRRRSRSWNCLVALMWRTGAQLET